jgi:hypothetical protein
MFFGRNEECGLRCVYHGWKFDRHGRCTDMPSEPPDSLFKDKVRIAAYPTHEAGGIIWTYLGPSETNPGPPDYELCRTPATHHVASKHYHECNWLQVLENSLDSVHFSFLHNEARGKSKVFYNAVPAIEFERAPYGIVGAALHDLGDGSVHARSYHCLLPAHMIRARTRDFDGTMMAVPSLRGQIAVPIDDEHCWLYSYLSSYLPEVPLTEGLIAQAAAEYGRTPGDLLPGYRLRRNRDNDYLLDREMQRTKNYSGIVGINTQDVALQEGMGPIVDRSGEHLAQTDRVIILLRRLLFEAMADAERGTAPQGVDPASYRGVRAATRVIPAGSDWRRTLDRDFVAKF